MKGFIKIMESVIASLVILSSMGFFLSFHRPNGGYDAQFDYALAALQKNATLNRTIMQNDVNTLNSILSGMLPATVDFSVEVSGIPNPVIKIMCACTDQEQSALIGRLSSLEFTYKRRNTEIRISNEGYAGGGLEGLMGSNPDADVLFFFGYEDLNSKKPLLQSFLENGTIFMLSDIAQSQAGDGVMDGLFGLEWDSGVPNSPNGDFADKDNAWSASYRIFRYYTALGGRDNDNFKDFSTNGNKIKLDGRTVVGPPAGNPAGSFVKVNEIGSYGRTVWFAGYDSLGPNAADVNRLLKAAMLWASGERFSMDPRFKIVPSLQEYSQHSYISVLDNSEPLAITLKVWNIFY